MLKNHLLSQLLGLDYDGDEQVFSAEEHNKVRLVNIDSVVESKIIQFNYTTYDIRWDHDTTRTTRGDIMMTCSRDDEPPFWYVWIIHAFHIQVHFCPGGVVARSRLWKFCGFVGLESTGITDGVSKMPICQR